MAFHDYEYDLYAELGNPEVSPLWEWSMWRQVDRILNPVMQAARGKPSVRTTQLAAVGGRKIPFGRLGWDDRSHQKWTHNSPSNGTESAHWEFLDVEVWAPSWTMCERENRSPDIFLSIVNETSISETIAFNPVMILAVSVLLPSEIRTAAKDAAMELAALVNARLAVTMRRPWGRASGSIGFSHSVQDLGVTGLFKVGNKHKRPVDVNTLAETWEQLRG